MNCDESFKEWWASLSSKSASFEEIALLVFKAGWIRGIEAERSDGR